LHATLLALQGDLINSPLFNQEGFNILSGGVIHSNNNYTYISTIPYFSLQLIVASATPLGEGWLFLLEHPLTETQRARIGPIQLNA